MMKVALRVFCCAFLAGCLFSLYAQSVSTSGTVRGSVLDPSGAVVKGASVEILNPVSGFNQTVSTNAQGNFQIVNIPYNNYHLVAAAPGFQNAVQDIDVRSPVPLELKIGLKIGTAS